MNPANRYRMAVLFSAAGFLWFICSFISKYVSTVTSPTESWIIYQSIDNAIVANGFSNGVSFVYRSLLASLTSLSPYISCAYLLVWLLLATRLINGFRQVKQFGTQGLGKVNIDLRLFVQEHATLLQIQKKVLIFTSTYVQSPLTIGFFKPLILLPVASLSHLSPEQVEAILLHELAHIKRHDYLVNIFVQVAEITLFFNPFMRLLLKQIKQERENCCDDYVLQFQYSAADYAKALLGIAQNRTATLLAMGAKNNQFQLLNRIKRMVAPQPQTFNYRQQLYMLCLVTILGLGITMIVPNSTAQTKKEVVVTKTTVQPKMDAPIATTDEENVEEPVQQPKQSYDFIKSIQHLASAITAKKMDLEDVEKTGKEIEGHNDENEAQAKQIADEALKNARPYIEKAEAISKNVSEKMATLDNYKFGEDGNINDLLAAVSQKVNEALKDIPTQINVPNSITKSVVPVASVQNAKSKFLKKLQLLPERKMLLTKEQINEQQVTIKKSMDSLQAAMVELGNSESQKALNKCKAQLAAVKSKEDWNIAFNEDEDVNNVAGRITTIYTNQMGKMIKKIVNGITTNVNVKDLNDIKIQLEGEIDKLQSDKINIQIMDKHQEKSHHKNTTVNVVTTDDENAQGS